MISYWTQLQLIYFLLLLMHAGTTFDVLDPPQLTNDITSGLKVYTGYISDVVADVKLDNPDAGFIGYITVGALKQDQINSIQNGSWDENDPNGETLVSYLVDVGRYV